jgi:crotonobetainyl-CoA:carnitine CoA-transferase CaiB-like acyl-CoA transferase
MGRADLAADAGLRSAGGPDGRLARRAVLDEAVSAWTATRPAATVQAELIALGVAAHAVQSSAECLADPQLAARRHFLELEHPDRLCLVENARFRLRRTPARVERRAPFLGEHTVDVLGDLLGYDTDRIADLAAAEALE